MSQRVLITAGAAGIGREFVRAFAATGAKVFTCDIDEKGLAALAKEIPGLVAQRCDMGSRAEIERMVPEALKALGGLDVLINNAGIYEGVADNAPDEEWHAAWHRTLTINLQSAADLSRLAVSHFLDRGGGGRIVNVTSRAAFRGDSPRHWHYAASKAAMVGMTRTIARGYAAEGILCFGVAPGFTVSEMTDEYLQGRGGAQIVADIPLGRVASTDEIAEVIRWLAVDAPASATGSIIDANGASYVR